MQDVAGELSWMRVMVEWQQLWPRLHATLKGQTNGKVDPLCRTFAELAFSRAGIPIRWEGPKGLTEVGIISEGVKAGQVVIRISRKYFRPSEVIDATNTGFPRNVCLCRIHPSAAHCRQLELSRSPLRHTRLTHTLTESAPGFLPSGSLLYGHTVLLLLRPHAFLQALQLRVAALPSCEAALAGVHRAGDTAHQW